MHWVLFFTILAIGLFARLWEFRSLPPGLNPDEASNGVDARSLYRYGTDRSGVPFPVKFVSWGGGQDALYGYMLVPFVAAFGLSPTVIRLPMLICGILSLPLLYVVAKATLDKRVALLSVFFLAISPWHILLSRWALEANLFPFLFLTAYACLLQARHTQYWFVPACIFFGLSLYAYGTAYAVVPAFVFCVIVLVVRKRFIRARYLILGVLSFVVVAVPVGLLLLINTFRTQSIMLGPITIPRFPVQARYEAATVIGGGEAFGSIATNLWSGIRLLATESDGILYNVVDPFGYFYRFSFAAALLGVALLVREMAAEPRIETAFLFAWLGSSWLIPIFQDVNINRFNIVFIPLLLCTAKAVDWLRRLSKFAVPAFILALLVCFAAFTVTYHGASYRGQAAWKFHAGLLGAVQFAQSVSRGPICVTDKVNMPYIYALFSEETRPSDFVGSVKYVDQLAPLRQVESYGRYTYGIRRCVAASDYTYVLEADEIPPRLGNRYKYEFFEEFVVYYAKP